ncbi:unnamed protein product [Didymodactylos carnosus]|uniref:Major facilitator superfamily (MFS) profile domain-containing protein n=1 Tax=Didymodactylos carnosus TaxID=1234261 RepID=A0A815CJH4_9BILA|nr:unnamed protein product [Didymodactylos carnosus]CAF1283696.1 unnamed protein product [Didymodactylos carnosus]CAF3727921.1 unnamed protein product [Didymodactylos carnosus]CAF4081327.1 unnamed protein product [Didymodactylos carnosus]
MSKLTQCFKRVTIWSSKQIFIVFAAFLVYVLADGTTFSFGLYVDELLSTYNAKKRSTLWISILAALTQSVPLLLSPFVCWLTMKWGARYTALVGTLVSSIGYMVPFFSTRNSIIMPTIGYGLLLSSGLAFCYVPAYLTLPYYFEEDRGLATGLAVSGSGVGQVILAVLIKSCIMKYGWKGASLITGGVFLSMTISALAFKKPLTSSSPEENTKKIKIPQITISDDEQTTIVLKDVDIDEVLPRRRTRGMTMANILLATVPIRSTRGNTTTTMESIQKISQQSPPEKRRSSFTADRNFMRSKPRSYTISNEYAQQRFRSNTIAVPAIMLSSTFKRIEKFKPLQSSQKFSSVIIEKDHEQGFHSTNSLDEETTCPIAPKEYISNTLIAEENEEDAEEGEMNELDKEKEAAPVIQKDNWLFNGRFLLFCLSNFLLCLVIGVPYVFLPNYIREIFDGSTSYFASWALSNVGIASAIGQILLGYMHDRRLIEAWIMYTVAVILSGIALVLLALNEARYKPVVLISAFVFGLAISANYALQLLIIIDALTIDYMPKAFGSLQLCQGISTLIGIPLQGLYITLMRNVQNAYKYTFLSSGLIIILSGVIMFLWPLFKPYNKT